MARKRSGLGRAPRVAYEAPRESAPEAALEVAPEKRVETAPPVSASWRGMSRDIEHRWEPRRRAMAAHILPGSTVLDLGAGTGLLRQVLPDGCRYIPVDQRTRAEGTIVVDLDSDAPLPECEADVITASGLLEYLEDVPAFLARVRATYNCPMLLTYNNNRGGARHPSWRNHYTLDDLRDIAQTAGWSEATCIDRVQGQSILRLVP